MVKLKNYNGHFCESDFENAFITFLEVEGWSYLAGDAIKRLSQKYVLITAVLETFLHKTNPDFTDDEVNQLPDNVRLVGAVTDFATLHKVYGWIVDGVKSLPKR